MKRKTRNLLLLSLAIIFTACSRSGQPADASLLSTIPADAPTVVVADLYTCVAGMGLRVSSAGPINASGRDADLSILPKSVAGPLSALARRRHCADLSHVAVFVDSASGALVFTALRISGTEIEDEPEKSRVAVLYDDNSLWVAAKPFDRDMLDSIRLRAAARSLADLPDDREFFTSYRPLRAMKRVPQFRNVAGEDFSTVYLSSRIDDTSLSLHLTYADSLGHKADPFARLSPIDDNVYSYLPHATVATFALGADRHTFRSILSNYGGIMPLRQRMAAELSSGFLCDSASTIAVGFAPGGSAETIADFSLDTWVFTALLPIEIDRTEDFIDIIDKLTQGALQCDIAGAYLAVSNASLDQVASGDDFGTAPSSATVRLQAVVPYRGELMKALGLKRGLSLEAEAVEGTTSVRISVLGGDEPPGEILLSLLTVLSRL